MHVCVYVYTYIHIYRCIYIYIYACSLYVINTFHAHVHYSIHTAIPIIIEGRFQVFQRFSSSKLVLKAVESCFVALNYYGNGSTTHLHNIQTGAHTPRITLLTQSLASETLEYLALGVSRTSNKKEIENDLNYALV